jgi:nitroreductase
MVQQFDKTDIFEIIRERRSIRKFTDAAVSEDILEKIVQAGFRAPFAYQICSIVYTRDTAKMKELKQMGVYPTTNVLMVFLIDHHRMLKIVEQRNYQYDFDDGLLLWLGIQDASLIAENIILAAEAYGLGSVLLGGAPLLADKIATVFNLPSKVMPVVALCLGYPHPEHLMSTRPRFPLKHSAFEDKYKDLTAEEINECMEKMDDGYLTQGYYIKQKAKIPLQEGEDKYDYDKYSWSEHISRKITQGTWYDQKLIDILEKRGFNIK